jgi:hypothetical protein
MDVPLFGKEIPSSAFFEFEHIRVERRRGREGERNRSREGSVLFYATRSKGIHSK